MAQGANIKLAEQREQLATDQPSPRPHKPSKRAVGVSELQWRLMLLALAFLALVTVSAVALLILAAFGGLHFA